MRSGIFCLFTRKYIPVPVNRRRTVLFGGMLEHNNDMWLNYDGFKIFSRNSRLIEINRQISAING